MNKSNILSKTFLVASLLLATYLVYSINSTISDKELISSRESKIIKKLEFIREAQIIYKEVHGNYTSNWDSLTNFIKNGTYPIVQKTETIIPLSYGADSIVITFDTLDIISAKDRIFKIAHNVNAANDGLFLEYMLNTGDKAIKGSAAYKLNQFFESDNDYKEVIHKFKNSGVVSSTVNFEKNQSITKGDLMMTLEETRFDPNINLDRIAYVPGYDDVKFSIFTGQVNKNNITVEVIEVRNTKPFNPARSEKNESNNKKPLRFGSKIDVTTSGNWE